MPHVPHLWDRYDEALEACAEEKHPDVRSLARAAAALIANGQIDDSGVLSDARQGGLDDASLDALKNHLENLL